MTQVKETEAKRILGAQVYMQADDAHKFAQVRAQAWGAFHAKAPM